MATSTFAPVTSSRPDDWTWITARWITRWKPAVGFEVLVRTGGEVGELGVDVLDEIAAEDVEVDVAGPHHRRGVLVFEKRQQEMFEGCVFLVPFAGERQRLVQGLLEAAGE